MISVKECIYLIDKRLEKLSTSSNQSIPIEDKILALNSAAIESVLEKIDVNNQYQMGLDAFRKRYQDLQILIKPYEELSLIKSNTENIYKGDLNVLKYKYFLYISIFLIASKGKCKDRKIDVKVKKHSDIPTLLNNSNYKPSFEYQETLATISSNKVETYTDGTFVPTKLSISYLTYPTKFDFPGYIDLEGNPSVLSNCNLPDYMTNEIVSIAVRDLAFDTGNQNAAQAAQIKQSRNN